MVGYHAAFPTSWLTISTARRNFALSSSVACTPLSPPPHPCGPPFIHMRSSLPYAILVSRPYISWLPGGDSTGSDFKMECNSSTRSFDDWSWASFFGAASWREGVPSGLTAEVMKRSGDVVLAVIVWIALGVGGANPPVIPVSHN